MHPDTIGATSSELKDKNATFLCAPVFGGQGIAITGKLVFAIGGPNEARQTVKPLIQDVMGRTVIDCGDEATKSSLLKIAGYVSSFFFFFLSHCPSNLLPRNIVTVSFMEAVGESQVFAEKSGLGTGPMDELIGEAFGPVAGGYSKRYAFVHIYFYYI